MSGERSFNQAVRLSTRWRLELTFQVAIRMAGGVRRQRLNGKAVRGRLDINVAKTARSRKTPAVFTRLPQGNALMPVYMIGKPPARPLLLWIYRDSVKRGASGEWA